MEASGIKFDGSFAGGRYDDSYIEGDEEKIETSFLEGDDPPDSYYDDPPEEAAPDQPSLVRYDDVATSFAGANVQSLIGQDNRREPTEIFPSQKTTANVQYHTLARQVAPDGSFVEVRNREVTVVRDEDTELPTGSRISITEFQSTLPMAVDNDRFFDADDGYQDLLSLAAKEMKNLTGNWSEPSMEMGFFGWLWRWFVRLCMGWGRDRINRLRYTRGIQEFLPFQTGFESFAVGGVIRAYDVDERSHDKFSLNLAFRNRNTSRILVQMLSRWDWIFHLCTQVTWSRMFDFLSFFPFFGWMSFPATENFPATKDLALRGIFRRFFESTWVTRTFLGRTEAFVTFDKNTAAQNLAAESTGFETANRNQYGAFFGREKNNEFRHEHRLPTDESIVRTFMTSPSSTMVNNGVEHVLRCLAKHWRNTLYQENGNFAHQRMEQLNPFEILRFHMPVVLSTLANLRGRNNWDTKTLGPFLKKLQHLNPELIKRRVGGQRDAENPGGDIAEIEGPCRAGQGLVKELKEKIVTKACGGVPSRIEPFLRWLDAIHDAFDELMREAEVVREFVASVDTGIKLGYQLIKLVDWSVPSEGTMKKAILDHIEGKDVNVDNLNNNAVGTALEKLSPKDERSLRELVRLGHRNVEAGKLLLGRACTMLERELRRVALDDRIVKLSKGPPTTAAELERHKWYWLDTNGSEEVVVYKSLHGSRVRLVHVETQQEGMYDMGPKLRLRQYIPIAEAISRAQKAFMIIETDYGKKFQYNAFMEFGSTEKGTSMRTRLRRLITLAQVFSPELDKARRNVLSEVKQSVQRVSRSKRFEASRLVKDCKPQNVTVLGGGPTGLLCAIHCLQNVILTGGKVKCYEKRDAFDQEGANFERAQIVRLDSRQISMLRYHLGTGFEDVYIPAKGETDSHSGNTLPNQGFVEVTIKRLESMILDEIINLRSKGLLYFYSGSSIDYNVDDGTFDKLGLSLKEDDVVFDPQDKSKTLMGVTGFTYEARVTPDQMAVGKDYDIVLPREKVARKFRLVEMNAQSDWYVFNAHNPAIKDVTGSFNKLPPVYRQGEGRAEPTGIMVDVKGTSKKLIYDDVKKQTFRLDFSKSHVIVALGGLTGACINCMSVNNLVGQALAGSTFIDRIQRYAFETNWSNGEVVQRGTGANYGQDGFLRPGFSYKDGVDYLFARVVEHYEIGADTDAILSRDWKIKIAAALVPKGLENDGIFCESLLNELEKACENKYKEEIKLALKQDKLSPGVETLISNEMLKLKKQWRRTGQSSSGNSNPRVSNDEAFYVEHVGKLIKSLMIALTLTIDYASQLRLENGRISSELWNQPNPVDSVIDDFAVEAQNFANALTQSAALAAGTVALGLTSNQGMSIFSFVLGLWNILVSFGSMTNVSRYKNRNEEMRRKISEEKMERVKRAVFSLMTSSQRERIPIEDNPFAQGLETVVRKFLEDCAYYNHEEAEINEFKQYYNGYKASRQTETQTFEFMHKIVGMYIPSVFYINSYLQEDLVNIYKSLHESLSLIKQAPSHGMKGADAVFNQLVEFDKALKGKIRKGDVKYGFLREGDWYHFLPETIVYLLGPCLFKGTIAGKTKSALKAVESLKAPGVNDTVLSRPIRDLTELYFATTESHTGSVMFLSGFVVFCFSVFFSIFRIIDLIVDASWAMDILMGAAWASLGSLLGALVAILHFGRKLGHLFGLQSQLGSSQDISKVRLVTSTQIFLVFVRLVAVVAAAVALPWSLLNQTVLDNDSDDDDFGDISQLIALGAVGAAVAAAVLFFLVEFFVRYNLPPALGQVVCGPLTDRIDEIRKTYEDNTLVEIETKQVLDKDAWEYTARQFLHEYRFDTVFAADRFGTILQNVQSGNVTPEAAIQNTKQFAA